MKKIALLMMLIVFDAISSITASSVNATRLLSDVPGSNESASDAGGRSGGNAVSLTRIFNFYSVESLARDVDVIKSKLTDACSRNVQKYVDGIETGEQWALKMDDASGRYSTGWFWGNTYWTGSQGLCENIVPKNYEFQNEEEPHVNLSRKPRDIQPVESDISPSQSKGYVAGGLQYSSPPPFPVGFFILSISVNSTLLSEAKSINVGLCLPLLCTDEDVKTIVTETSVTSNVELVINSIRSPHHHYNIWQDTTFIILCVITSVVVLFLILGTSYDLYLKHDQDKKRVLSVKCSTFPDQHIKLNGSHQKYDKSCLYVVNNNNNNNLESTAEICMEPNIQRQKESLVVSIVKQVFLAFSLRINIKTICDRTVGSDTISSIHGLKAISMVWVILGHTCIIAFKYSDNMEYRKVVQKEFIFQTITNGHFSVDTFFFTSGLLVSFLYFRTNAKGKLDQLGEKGFLSGCLHFGGLVSYRFARLSAPYLFVLGAVEVCMKWFNYNSIFEPPAMDHVNCPKYWWRNILYINTLFPVEQMCMLWSWYLSDDTQFYVLGAILLIVAVRHFKIAGVSLMVFMISSWLTTGYVALSNDHLPSTDDPLALFDQIYDKPYTRLGPYLVGMVTGWFLFKTNCRFKMTKLGVVVGWLVSAACMLSIVYGLYEVDLSPIAGAAYSSLSHTAWALGLAWIVIACATGHGGFANTILSATILYPISRVTYCAYLLHPLVMRVMVMTMDTPLHLGKPLMVTVFLGQVFASYVFGFIVSVMFEAPIVSILKILTRIAPPKPKRVPS